MPLNQPETMRCSRCGFWGHTTEACYMEAITASPISKPPSPTLTSPASSESALKCALEEANRLPVGTQLLAYLQIAERQAAFTHEVLRLLLNGCQSSNKNSINGDEKRPAQRLVTDFESLMHAAVRDALMRGALLPRSS